MLSATRFLAPLVAALVVTAACSAPRAASTPTPSATGTPSFTGKTLNIVTGGTGAVYIVYGAGLAELLNKKLGTAASAQSTTASVDNMKLIRDAKADVAFTLADTAFDAVNGSGSFAPPEKKADAKALAVLYSNLTHLVVKDAAGINTAADVMVSGVANLLVVPSSFDPALAQAILATMFDNKADLVKVHVAASDLTLETATVGSPIDFHQGAIDYYKSKGAWKK